MQGTLNVILVNLVPFYCKIHDTMLLFTIDLMDLIALRISVITKADFFFFVEPTPTCPICHSENEVIFSEDQYEVCKIWIAWLLPFLQSKACVWGQVLNNRLPGFLCPIRTRKEPCWCSGSRRHKDDWWDLSVGPVTDGNAVRINWQNVAGVVALLMQQSCPGSGSGGAWWIQLIAQ